MMGYFSKAWVIVPFFTAKLYMARALCIFGIPVHKQKPEIACNSAPLRENAHTPAHLDMHFDEERRRNFW